MYNIFQHNFIYLYVSKGNEQAIFNSNLYTYGLVQEAKQILCKKKFLAAMAVKTQAPFYVLSYLLSRYLVSTASAVGVIFKENLSDEIKEFNVQLSAGHFLFKIV
jgi:hypothetical protein